MQGLLHEYGIKAGRNRVRRLMRENETQARKRKAYRKTTNSNHRWPVAPDLVKRKFNVDAPDLVWVGDITYIRTNQSWLYLAVVIDLFSRRVVGWSMSSSLERKLCLDAVEMAIQKRRPKPGLKSEALFNRTFENREEATMAIFEYIEVYYNRKAQPLASTTSTLCSGIPNSREK